MSRKIESRWSHLVGYCGVGSLVRADDDLFAIKDIRSWTKRDGSPAGEVISYVDLLRATLGIERELRQPPVSEVQQGIIIGESLPAIRFPGWARCPRCGLLHWLPWRDKNLEEEGGERKFWRCTNCTDKPLKLQQVGWVEASSAGGMREVDWHFQAHSKFLGECSRDNSTAKLFLNRQKEARRWEVRCGHCNSKSRFDTNFKREVRELSRQPWQWSDAVTQSHEKCEAELLEVSDPRLFYPRVRSALVIPPESRVKRGTVLDRLYSNRDDREALELARTSLARRQRLRRLASKYHCSVEEVENSLQEIKNGYPLYGHMVTTGELMMKEYEAFCEEIPDLDDSEDFVPRHKTAGWRAERVLADSREEKVLKFVDQLVGVTRLREVRIFEGFTRIYQHVDDGLRQITIMDSENDDKRAKLIPPDLDGSMDWFPAIELFGEGIFFTLSGEVLGLWSEQPGLMKRAKKLEKRFESAGMNFPDADLPPLEPRFILLHTLAHLLIRQLETRAGYPAASIRERIYFSNENPKMAGILYVAVPDIVGSLGGLAELAEPRRFLQLLSGVFSSAEWCSLDPVCIEHEGQGPNQLNLAACHACSLAPETSCQFGNVLLDRAFVRGSIGGGVSSVLEFVDGGT